SLDYESKLARRSYVIGRGGSPLARGSSPRQPKEANRLVAIRLNRPLPSMILETARIILRPFREQDIDLAAPLMANPDFMRFSLGVFSREQTAAFLEKILSWQGQGLPSQFAVIFRQTGALIGYCGFFHHHVDGTDETEIGYRL